MSQHGALLAGMGSHSAFPIDQALINFDETTSDAHLVLLLDGHIDAEQGEKPSIAGTKVVKKGADTKLLHFESASVKIE